jgi:hypothetical protein
MSAAPTVELPKPGQLEYAEEALLSDPIYDEPLIAGGVRCHGGFIDGKYVSPRTLVRGPAVAAWKQRLREQEHPLIYVPRKFIPPQYPSYEQSKLLLLEGVRDPMVRALTTISIVEGFGAMIRDVPVPDLRKALKEDLTGTALAHLSGGLFEAHARDEAGHRDQGGHKQMWEAARDLALDKPEIPGDVLLRMMSGPPRRRPEPLFPDLPQHVEALISAMANVMVVEIFAFDVFKWGERLLGDPEVSSKPREAGAMVSYIRADETPHVEYLRTALSEIRCRTLLTREGREIPGREVVDRLFERQLEGIASTRPRETRDRVRAEVRDALGDRPGAGDLVRRFESLDSGWTFPKGDDAKIELRLADAA